LNPQLTQALPILLGVAALGFVMLCLPLLATPWMKRRMASRYARSPVGPCVASAEERRGLLWVETSLFYTDDDQPILVITSRTIGAFHIVPIVVPPDALSALLRAARWAQGDNRA